LIEHSLTSPPTQYRSYGRRDYRRARLYRTETIGRSDCRPIVRLSADTIVRWDYRPNPSYNEAVQKLNGVTSSGFKCYRRSCYHIIPEKNDLCCFGCVTSSLLHRVVNW